MRRITRVHVRLGRFDREPIHHFEAGRHDTARDDAADGIRGRADVGIGCAIDRVAHEVDEATFALQEREQRQRAVAMVLCERRGLLFGLGLGLDLHPSFGFLLRRRRTEWPRLDAPAGGRGAEHHRRLPGGRLGAQHLADGLLGGRSTLVTVAAIGLGVSAAATWFLRLISDRTQRRFRDRVTIALESGVAQLQASIATIAHHERAARVGTETVQRDKWEQ